jgi:hypothetical protein
VLLNLAVVLPEADEQLESGDHDGVREGVVVEGTAGKKHKCARKKISLQ